MAGRFDETLQELNRKYGTELNSDSVRSAQEADRVKAESRAQNNWGSSNSVGSTFSGSRLLRNTGNQQSVWLKKYQGKGYKSLATALSAMDDGDEKKWLTSYADRVKRKEWQELVDSKPEDWIQNSDYGLQAYQQDRETASYDRQLQNWINQMAEAPLQDADPQYYQMVQQYRKDTSYKEMDDRWSEEQQRDFGYLYAQDKKKAEEYAIAVNDQLNSQEKEKQRQAVQAKATSGFLAGLGETGKAIAAGMTGIADYTSDLAEYHARGRITERGDQLTLKEYSDSVIGGVSEHLNTEWGMLDKSGWSELMEQNARYQRTGTVGDQSDLMDHVNRDGEGFGLGDMYGIGVSAATSMLSAHALGQAGSLVQFFGSAAASAVDDARNRGASDEQALAYGAALGASESLTELIPIDSLLNIGKAAELKGALWSILKQGGEEFLGEGMNSIISSIADHYIMADKSNFQMQKQVYMDNGMTEEEAKKQAWKDLLKGITYDAVTGAASGALSGSVTLGVRKGLDRIIGNATDTVDNATDTVDNATDTVDNATELLDNTTPVLGNTDAALEKSTPGGVTEESSAVDDNLSATESTVSKMPGKNESSAAKVGVSKMETVQVKPDLDSFARQFGNQAKAVKQNYIDGQDLQEYEVGFQTAFAIGKEGGKAEALTEQNVPYLTRSQREIAFSMGRDAAMAEKIAEQKTVEAKGNLPLQQTAHLITEDGSDGGTVTIAEIESMDENGMTFRLDDGRTVTDEELDFPEGAEVYSAVMELGMDAESANAVVRASASATQPRATVAEGIETAYRHGKYGYGMEALLKTQEAAGLPESVLQESYLAGEKYRRQSRETAQNAEAMAGRKVVGTEVKGNVYFAGDSDALNNVQRESLRGLEWIADLTGAQIYVEDISNDRNLSRINGQYDPADDSIHIDLRAGSDGTGTLLYTAAHEFTHRMKQNNEAAFFRLADFLVAEYGKKGITTDSLVKQQMADAAADGIDLNYDEAFEEMVSDAMEAMFTDTDALAKMEKLKTQDKSLWQEIKDFVLGLAEKIKAAYSRLKPDSAEARYVLQMKESLDQMAKLFAEGVMSEKTDISDKNKGKVKYSFAGRSAATADQSALQRAEQMADQGVDNETIRQKTGWYKGMDGKWRYEINDSQMEISENISNYMRLGDLMQHENLYAAYPDLADISVVFQGLNKGVNGSYSPQFDSIDLSYKLKNDPFGLKDALVHEIQHAIQHREGFTSGSTVGQWERKIKAGFDSRRAADIRKAQETERELRRIQDEEPEFYRDMVELDAMTPDLPRGKVDWETLEQIEEDPVEWQQYDARREELEAKYGDTKVWDMNDLLYQREKAAKNLGRTAEELYFDTAGEIEARDASNRLSKSPEQRKSSPPRLGNEDTVFSEGNAPADDYIPGIVSEKEIADNIKAIAEMESVISINGDEFKMGDGRLLTDVTAFFDSIGGSVYNSRLGDVYLRKRGVRHDLGHGMSDEKAASFAAIPAVLEHGQVAGFVVNKGGKGFDSATVAAPITIGNAPYMMGVIVHRSNKENRFYVHDVVAIKEEAAPLITGTHNVGETGGATSTISIIRKILSVKAKQTESKKKSSRRKQTETESLRQQNEKLRDDVERLQELVKLQGKVTNGKIMQPSSVDAAAKYLKKMFHTDGDIKELAKLLNDFYKYIASDPELTWEGVKEQAAPVVDWLQENEKFQRSQYAQDILDSLKGQSFYLDETQLGEAKSQYGSVANYRRAVKNMASSKASQSLDQLWQELSSQYPDIFSPEISASDMPVAFAEAIERLGGMENTESSMDWRLKDQTMLEVVYDSYWRVSGLETVADKYSKKIFEIRGKHYAKMTELRRDRDRKLKEAQARKEKVVQTVRENREKSTEKTKIRKTISKLNKLLVHGNKQQNIKKGMEDFAATALASAEILFADSISNEDMILNGIGTDVDAAENRLIEEVRRLMQARKDLYNLGTATQEVEEVIVTGESESYAQRMAESERLDRKISEKMGKLKSVFERERNRLNKATVSAILEDLAKAYKNLGTSDAFYIQAATDEQVYQHLLNLQETIGGTTIRDMNMEQLKAVSDALTMVLTTIQNANRLFGKLQKLTVETMTKEAAAQIRSNGIDTKDPPKGLKKASDKVNEMSWQNLRPVDAFRRLGSEKMMDLFWGLVDGMNERGKMTREIRDYLVKARHDSNYSKFDLKKADTYTTVDGKKMRLTLGEKMSIYAYSKREAAFDHMTKGGFTYAEAQAYKDEKGVTRYHNNAGGTWRLSLEDLENICNSLTAEQKRYADMMQKFLTEFGQRGNKVSRALFGIDLFKEQNYFPLMSNHDYLNSVQTELGATQTAASLKNSGFTKSTTPGANNPIVLKNFDDVCLEHLDKMMNYIALTLPLENLRKVYDNVSSASENTEPQSTKALIGAVYGKSAQKYFDQFLKDANGTRAMTGAKNPLANLFGKSKAAAVSANVSVMIQQISAVVRASAEISPAHLVFTRGYGKGTTRGKQSYKEMMTYSGIANIKDMGGYDVGSNTGLKDYLGMEEAPMSSEKAWDIAQDVFGFGAEFMDKVGWTMIWNAVKREVASRKQYTVNSAEFFQACADRFEEVVVKTQVFDSVLSRSGYMRSDNDSVKYLTSFMGEPTVTAGMVFNSHLEVLRAVKNQKNVSYHVGKLVRTDAALIVTLLLNGMLKALPYAARDDDEDESYWERWARHFGDSLRGDLNPLNLLPVARDISSILEGRTIDRPDLALLADLITTGKKAAKALMDEDAREELQSEDYWQLAEDVLGAIGNLAGVPVQNIWRDAESYLRIIKDIRDGIETVELRESLERGLRGEQKTKLEGIYDAMISGDTARLDALKATYKTDSSYESAVRKALRLHDPRIKEMANARYEGDYDRLEALSYEIEAEGIFDMATIRAAYEAERTAQAKDRGITLEEDSAAEQAEESTVFSMEEYYAAIRNGSKDSIQIAYNALIEEKRQEYYLEREAQDSVASSVTSKVKGEYLDEDISRADAKSILTKYGGKSKVEAETEIKKWEFQMEYHYSWGSRDRCYRSGTITRSQLVSAVMDIEDASREKAQEYVDFLELEMQNEKVDITASEASSYFEHAKPHGISVEVYLDYKARTKGIQNDKDANGDSIPYTAVQKIMTEIDKLPISSNQKYALARSNGWAEKTIQKYKKW